jgi:hypothetical protein
MKAKLFFLSLSDEQAAEVNAKGWGGVKWGKAYMGATFGDVGSEQVKAAKEAGLYKYMGTMTVLGGAESIWTYTQNLSEAGWVEEALGNGMLMEKGEGLSKKGTLYGAKSMSVGDVIVWANGKVEVAAGIGFNEVTGGEF